ncbi:YadA-like family protein [Fusobacterium necrophorum]|uniref:YadA-like family protein n=1 Tax=Fusobacterium necrophorum TaxID=859 RepID=UPI0025508147|nr:YadA-like family protein [Fusobacterium necrophorum]MDK4501884.1 YadA-like family protein [Fusobacterium necrophorum]
MKNNLEKLVKGCFKRKFSMSLAALTLFAITGSVGYGFDSFKNYIWLVPGNLISTHDIVAGEDLHVLGDSIVNGGSYVEGDSYVYKNQYVYGTSYVAGDSIFKKNLTVKKNLKVLGDSVVNGDSVVKGGSYVEDDSYVYKNQYVYGTSYVKGNAAFKGDLSVDGNLTLGDLNVKEGIEKNTKEIAAESERRALADTRLAYEIGTNRGNINKLEKEVEARREADERQDKAIAANSSAIKHLDRKVNKGTAMTVAMSNVDFQNVNTGEVAIGAGIGHYVGDQAVAVGIAYGVNEDLKVHAKWSGVAGDPHYNAIGGGVTYKFKTR